MFLKNLRLSARSLVKNKLFSFLGIFSFAVGFSVCLVIGLYLHNELTADGFHKSKQNIFRLVNAKDNNSRIDYLLNEKLASDFPGIEKACPVIINHASETIEYNNDEFNIDGIIYTTNTFFEVFSINTINNIYRNLFNGPNDVVLTETAAKTIFGDEYALGKSITVKEKECNVSAVIKDFPVNSSIQGQIMLNADNENNRGGYTVYGRANGDKKRFNPANHYILLEEGQDYHDIEQRISTSIGKYDVLVDSAYLQPLKSIYFDKTVADQNLHGNINFVKILSVIGFLILLLSSVNYINYIISNQFKKHKEIGIKKTIGARHSNLLGYYITDILLWIFISLIFSVVIVGLVIPYFNAAFQVKLQISNLLDVKFVTGALIVILFITLSSLIPYIIMLTRFRVLNFIKGNFGKKTKVNAGSVLTVFQLTISVLLISGVLVIQKQIHFVKFRDLGFNDNELMYIDIPYYASEAERESIKNELLKNPFIEQATLSSGGPGQNLGEIKSDAFENIYYLMEVDQQFIPTLGIELKDGRNFISSDNQRGTYLLNEAAVATMEFDDLDLTQAGFKENIGTVKNFNFTSLHQSVHPLVLLLGTGRSLSLRINTDNLADVMSYINNVWADFYPEEQMQYKFYDAWFDSMYRKEEQISSASIIFSIIAIVITCLGLLGKIIQVTVVRTKEIGIRKVNGAKVVEILTLLNKDFLMWVIVATIIATPIAYYAMNKWLENFAFKTELSWWIFALAGLLALGIALLTVSFQSWKAATRNPVEALRYE